MLVNSRKLSESIVSSDGCRLLDRAGANGRLFVLSPFGRDGRAGASEGKEWVWARVRNRSGQLARAGVTNAGGVGSHAVPMELGLIFDEIL